MKAYKIIFNTVLAFVILSGIYFFGFTDSYKKSIEAKVKYMTGDYTKARELAKEAFDMDPYNRMAITMLAQSRISAEFVDYVEDSKNYLLKIENITKKENFSSSDKTKIKMMCEVMLGRYKKLSSTVMTDKDLKNMADDKHKVFKKIYEELFPTKE